MLLGRKGEGEKEGDPKLHRINPRTEQFKIQDMILLNACSFCARHCRWNLENCILRSLRVGRLASGWAGSSGSTSCSCDVFGSIHGSVTGFVLGLKYAAPEEGGEGALISYFQMQHGFLSSQGQQQTLPCSLLFSSWLPT